MPTNGQEHNDGPTFKSWILPGKDLPHDQNLERRMGDEGTRLGQPDVSIRRSD